mmetsp:Transcript_29472/g.83122  ORF Transcript_29472/g.83122 Transcript_29472/m.83122 type:complete len:393 (+) Transcript_29472:356-1534(+)
MRYGSDGQTNAVPESYCSGAPGPSLAVNSQTKRQRVVFSDGKSSKDAAGVVASEKVTVDRKGRCLPLPSYDIPSQDIRQSILLWTLLALEQMVLVAVAVALSSKGMTAFPLLPMVVCRAAEAGLLILTNSPVHLVMACLQPVLAGTALGLYVFAERYQCMEWSLFSGRGSGCGAVTAAFSLLVLESFVLCAETAYHIKLGTISCLASQSKMAHTRSTIASGFGSETFVDQKASSREERPNKYRRSLPRAEQGISQEYSASSSPSRSSHCGGSVSAMPSEFNTPFATVSLDSTQTGLAMPLWQLNEGAAAASNWLREGAYMSDWWQMPNQGQDPYLTVRGFGGEPLVIEAAADYAETAGPAAGDRACMLVSITMERAGSQGSSSTGSNTERIV